MVAISIYRGNLHKVSSEPRRWAVPPQTISPTQFRSLLARRNRALSSLYPVPALNGDANDVVHPSDLHQHPSTEKGGGNGPVDRSDDSVTGGPEHVLGGGLDANATEGTGKVCGNEGELEENVGSGATSDDHRAMEVENVDTIIEEIGASGPIINRKKRKFDLEKNLENLNKEKHRLVQVLKQILNAEEEIKRRQAPVVGQAEASANMGYMATQTPQRVGSDVNPSRDSEGEPGEVSTFHAHSTQAITSPSSGSLLAMHGTTTSYTAAGSNWLASGTGSLSSFATSTRHTHPTSLPPLEVAGMQFTASTPSPAGSTGTPNFRDARLTSQPWSQR